MSALITGQGIAKAFGTKILYTDLNFAIEEKCRIGIIGNNGAGKSTFFKLLLDQEEPDHGQIIKRNHLKISHIPQKIDVSGCDQIWTFARAKAQEAGISEDEIDIKVSAALSQGGFDDFSKDPGTLSGGWQKRLGICCGLLSDPDLLLLDEPTNHLDWDGILWLEKFLSQTQIAWIMISHDRFLLNKTAKTIFYLDKNIADGVLVTKGNFDDHLQQKELYFAEIEKRKKNIDNKLRTENEWLARSPKARTTKSRSRVDAAHELISEQNKLKHIKEQEKTDLSFSFSNRKSKKLIEIEELNYTIPDKSLLKNFTFTLSDRSTLGIVGSNGVGKSTLFRLLTDHIKADSGSIKKAEGLKIVYFEQLGESLNPDLLLKRALSEHGDHVIYQDRSIHIVTWAKKFGFDRDQLEQKVETLSGGEKAKVLIANLMLQKADILLLDEPTNDLDIPTLEVLEESLASFPGAVMVISHDRYLLEKLCRQYLFFPGNGTVIHLASLEQCLLELNKSSDIRIKKPTEKNKDNQEKSEASQSIRKKKLSYKEKREFESMEESIFSKESELEELQSRCEEPEILKDGLKLKELSTQIELIQKEIETMYQRWSELEAIDNGIR